MKILSTTAGGVVKNVDWIEYGLGKELIKLGHKVDSYSSINVQKVFHHAKKKEKIDGINVKRFNPLSPFLLQEMLKNDWDLIHGNHLGYLAPISSFAAIRKKIKSIPMVFTVHGLYHDPFIVKDVQDPFSKPINYRIAKSFILNPADWFTHLPLYTADKVTALTEWEKDEIKKLGIPEEKITVIPNGINIDKFSKVKSGKNFREKYNIEGPMILFIGQPIRRKGLEYLIGAMPEIIKEFENVKCFFVGYRKNNKLEELCDKLNIKSNVIFLGFLSEQKKVEALTAADIFVFPTLYEGFGTVVVEAMAAGCPVVTTNVAGNSEIVKNNRNGILVKPKSSEEISKAVIKLLKNNGTRKKMGSRNRIEAKKYGWKNVAKKFEAVFEEVSNG